MNIQYISLIVNGVVIYQIVGYKHYMSIYAVYLYCIAAKYAVILRQGNEFKFSRTN